MFRCHLCAGFIYLPLIHAFSRTWCSISYTLGLLSKYWVFRICICWFILVLQLQAYFQYRNCGYCYLHLSQWVTMAPLFSRIHTSLITVWTVPVLLSLKQGVLEFVSLITKNILLREALWSASLGYFINSSRKSNLHAYYFYIEILSLFCWLCRH